MTLITILVLLGFDAYCLLDLARAREDEVRYFPRWVCAAICIISTPLGGLAYLIYGRPRRAIEPPRAPMLTR